MEQNPQPGRINKLALQVGIGALIVIIYFAVVFFNKRSQNNLSSGSPEPTPQTSNITPIPSATVATNPTPTQSNAPTSLYKDGTYSATGSYFTPGGQQSIGVTLTLANGVVTSSSVTPQAKGGDSKEFQAEFASNYKQFVIGKPISSLNLTKVAGSSLTGQGFNKAVEQIKTQAQL